MSRSARTKATDISPSVRKIVHERDGGCIFCRMEHFTPTGARTELMHYVSRYGGGLGIPENLAEGCIIHHRQMDQGPAKERQLLRALFRWYLRQHYPDWSEEKLKYQNRWEHKE